jgi:hypothetical protein
MTQAVALGSDRLRRCQTIHLANEGVTARSKNTMDLTQSGYWVGPVLDRIAAKDCIELTIRERQRGDVRDLEV